MIVRSLMANSSVMSLSARYRALFRVRLSLAQRIGLFLLVSALVAGFTFWLQPRVAAFGAWGYPLGFVINGLSAATVVVPSAGFAAVLVMARDLHPLLLGIAAGVGGVFGELTGYWLGTYCRVALADTRLERFLSRYMGRFGGGIIFGAGLLPFIPVDATGLAAGAVGYPVRRFLLYLSLGKISMTVAVLYLANAAFDWTVPFLDWL